MTKDERAAVMNIDPRGVPDEDWVLTRGHCDECGKVVAIGWFVVLPTIRRGLCCIAAHGIEHVLFEESDREYLEEAIRTGRVLIPREAVEQYEREHPT